VAHRVRTAGDPLALTAAVKAVVAKFDKLLAVTGIRTMDEIASKAVPGPDSARVWSAGSLQARPISLQNWISLAGLPVLCVLCLEAMQLRRSVTRMGNGLLTRGWVALMAAFC
jgi:hypothetical protein